MKLVFGAFFIISIITLIGLGIGLYIAYATPRHKLILGLLIVITLVSVAGMALGLQSIYKAHKQLGTIAQLSHQLQSKQKLIETMNQHQARQLLFIHHSVGQGWLDSGGLAQSLLEHGIGVHDATYGDIIGEETDLNHWVGKFEKYMDKIIKFNYHPDVYYGDSRENDIIMFKSCFPNSNITSEGAAPGNPNEPVKTLWNYKATFTELINDFAKYPNKVFIYVTAPPLVPSSATPENAARAREFNNWVKSEFVAEYRNKTGLNNFLVFDFFDVLADSDNFLRKEYRASETDSHPKSNGTKIATELFIQFLQNNGIIQGK